MIKQMSAISQGFQAPNQQIAQDLEILKNGLQQLIRFFSSPDPLTRTKPVNINGKDIPQKIFMEGLFNSIKNHPLLKKHFEGISLKIFKKPLDELNLEIFQKTAKEDPGFLNSFETVVSVAMETTKREERLEQARLNYGRNVPIAQINEWLAEIDQLKAMQQKAAHQDPTIARLDLENQIELIQKYQYQIQQTTNKILQEQGQLTGWSENERKYVLQIVSQRVAQKTALSGQPTRADLTEIIKQLGEEDYLASLVLGSENTKTRLIEGLAIDLSYKENQQTAGGLASAQESLDKVMVMAAPSGQELNKIVQSTFGLEGKGGRKRANKFLSRLESNWPQISNPTNVQIMGALTDSLSVREFTQLKMLGISEKEFCQALLIPVKSRFQISKAGGPFPKRTLKLAQKLGLDPAAIDLWLNGVSLEQIRGEREKAKGIDKTILERFENKTKEFSTSYKDFPGVRKLQFNILRVIRTVRLKFGIYRHLPKGLQIIIRTKRSSQIVKVINFWAKPGKRIRTRIASGFFSRGGRLLRKGGLLGKLATTSRGRVLSAIFMARGAAMKAIGTVFIVASPVKYLKTKIRRLIAKGAATAILAILGLGSGGIGTLASVLFYGGEVLRFLKEQGVFKKLAEPLAVLAGAAIALFNMLPWTFSLAGIGGIIAAFTGGSAAGLILLGGGIGFFIDTTVVPWLNGLGGASASLGAEAAALGGKAPGLASMIPAAEPAAAGLLSSLGPAVAVPVTIAGITTATVFTSMAQNASFVLPHTTPFIEEEESLYFSSYIEINKSAVPKILNNSELPNEITYTISISAIDEEITNIKILNSTIKTTGSGAFPVNEDKNSQSINSFSGPDKLAPEDSPWTKTYTILVNNEFRDSRVTDTVTITADVPSLSLENETGRAIAETIIGNPSSGPIFDCPGSGQEIIVQAGSYPVQRILLTNGRPGYCINPTMIVIHWSGGWSNNDATRTTLETRNRSCQIGTEGDGSVQQWQQLWENIAEGGWCVGGDSNLYALNNEMVGAWFDTNPPPEPEIESSVLSTCWFMKQYNIPWTQIFGHYELWEGKSDPGEIFLNGTFIPRVRQVCGGSND